MQVHRLPIRQPYAWKSLTTYLSVRATPGIEAVVDGRYRRSVCVAGHTGWVEVGPAHEDTALNVSAALPNALDLGLLVAGLSRVFDCDADPREIDSRLAGDPAMEPLIQAHPGLRLPGAWNGFELAIRAILGQQVTVKGATTLAGRLAARFGEAAPSLGNSGLTHLFPTPEALAEGDPSEIGMPKARGRAIKSLAAAVRDGSVALDGAMDTEELQAALVALPGIGKWTADYVAMRALRDPDAFPAGDLGLIRAAKKLGIAEDEKTLLARSEVWRPWRAYAAQHLWLSESADAGSKNSEKEAKKSVLHAHG